MVVEWDWVVGGRVGRGRVVGSVDGDDAQLRKKDQKRTCRFSSSLSSSSTLLFQSPS